MINCESCKYASKFTNGLILCRRTKTSIRVNATDSCKYAKEEKIMNDINEMPPKCQYCPYWEVCEFPWVCPDIEDKKSDLQPTCNNLATDCISRQAAIDAIEFGITYARAINKETGEVKELFQEANDELKKAVERVKELPSAQPSSSCGHEKDAQPERKRGKWIYNSPVTMKCNQCGLVIKDWDWHRFKYCPNCGADMREVDDERPD